MERLFGLVTRAHDGCSSRLRGATDPANASEGHADQDRGRATDGPRDAWKAQMRSVDASDTDAEGQSADDRG